MGNYAVAVVNYTNALQNLTFPYVDMDTIIDQVFDTSPLFALMRANNHLKFQRGGLYLATPINIAKSPNFTWYSGQGGWKMTTVEGVIQLAYDWKLAHDGVVITGEEILKNEGADEAIADLVQERVDVAALTPADSISGDMYNNNPYGTNLDGTAGNPQSVEGLCVAIDDGTISGTIGQQSRTTNPILKAKVNYNGAIGATLIPNLQALWLAANRGGQSMVKVNFTTELIMGSYWGLLQNPERYTIDPHRMEGLGLKTTGGNNLAFNDAPVLVDEKIPTGVQKPVAQGGSGGFWYGMNTDFFELVAHPDRFFALGEWHRDPYGDVYFLDVWFAGAFKCLRPNKNFVLWASGG